MQATVTRTIIVTGQVQGVGFRPFIFRLAKQCGISGHVSNSAGQVMIVAQGDIKQLQRFQQGITEQPPPLSKPAIQSSQIIEHELLDDFVIKASQANSRADIHIPPDYFMCADCQQEISDPQQRRYRYPFTNCTQCGPRYSIINALPYDRHNTSMQDFPLCPACLQEYRDPLDRRFHAQPLACAECGPSLSFRSDSISCDGNEAALQACVSALRQGQIIATKGIGGYHLMCDAGNDQAIEKLRRRKHRPHKPLAVMFPFLGSDGLDSIRQCCRMNEQEQQLLLSPQRSIVLLQQTATNPLSGLLVPGLKQLGAFLPYSPLHHILLQDFGAPLVATSGNISGEPVITDPQQAEQRLQNVADAFLHHNRPIVRPADDSVVAVIRQQPVPLRIGRGLAPLELSLQTELQQPVLAVGGHLKVTVALAWQNRLVISPHISDFGSARGDLVFRQVIADLQRLYQVKAKQIVCDAHHGYASHQWAQQQDVPVQTVWHHHAHASGIAGEYPDIKNWLCFCWDGTGLGCDGTLWGGETFVGRPGDWRHVAAFRQLRLSGGDKAGREPWRSASAWRWQLLHDWLPDIDNSQLALAAWRKQINTPLSSAAGRLFDAAACMVLGIKQCSFEGQAAMQLEAIADDSDAYIDLPIEQQDILRVDWSPLTEVLLNTQLSTARRAAIFHNSMAHCLIKQALQIRRQHAFDAIGLSGGVFQNRRLCSTILQLAEQQGLQVLLPTHLPVNDGGLSYGQIVEYAANRLPNRQ